MRFSFFVLLALSVSPFRSQNFDSACVQQKHVISILNQLHYDPPVQNSTTTREVIDLFIRAADEKNIFFIKEDTAVLNALARTAQGADAYCQVISQCYRIYTKRIIQLDSIASAIEVNPLDLDGKDTINFVYQKRERQYCSGMQDLHKRIEKRIKYDALQYLASPAPMLASASVMREENTNLPVFKAKSRAVQKFRRTIADLHEPRFLLTHLSDCMSNAIARRCDPHSNYLNISELGKYRKALSTHERSFGFSVSENKNGEHVVDELVPGGPAWKNEALNENDVIAGLTINGVDIPLQDMETEEINAQIGNAAGEDLDLTVIGSDLQVHKVTLYREKIASVENALNSYVVNTSAKRIGFIPIPSFYMDQENDNRQGLANDVAKEIVELKRDSVEGIILDLRFNGGGSMREAIALAGLFINEGPVAIYKHRGDEPFLLKDMNRGTSWDGPLLILINSASASASEFVTAALQDHNRAIIAGSESFGKGTAQNLLPADTTATEESLQNGFKGGYLKITGGKFYRLNSRSHQAKGITPDIVIPGVIEKVMERESSYPFALPCDSVNKAATFEPLKPLPVAELANKSKERQQSNPRFARIASLADSLATVTLQTERIALCIKEYKAYNERQKKLNMQMETLFKWKDSGISIRNNTSNMNLVAMSEFLKRSTEKTIAALEQDVTFQESVYIMSDLIDVSKK
jgi:carboxyl-terminal processing protease